MSIEISRIRRIRMRAPTYWKYVREKPGWGMMFLCARILAARRIERIIACAKPRFGSICAETGRVWRLRLSDWWLGAPLA